MRDPEEKQAEAAEKPMDHMDPQRAGHFENLPPSNCRAICREHDDFIVIYIVIVVEPPNMTKCYGI